MRNWKSKAVFTSFSTEIAKSSFTLIFVSSLNIGFDRFSFRHYLSWKCVSQSEGGKSWVNQPEGTSPLLRNHLCWEYLFRSSFKCEIRPYTASVTIVELTAIALVSPEMRVASFDIRQHGQHVIFDPYRRIAVASDRETLLHFSIWHLDMNTSTFLEYIHFHILCSRDISHQHASETLDRQSI